MYTLMCIYYIYTVKLYTMHIVQPNPKTKLTKKQLKNVKNKWKKWGLHLCLWVHEGVIICVSMCLIYASICLLVDSV